MGWHINLIESTLKLNKNTAKEIFKYNKSQGDDTWWDLEDVLDENGYLTFNDDHMEHMDFLGDEAYRLILKKGKAKGRVLFSSNDGDNAGEYWGYEFDGNGNMNYLKAEINWVIDK